MQIYCMWCGLWMTNGFCLHFNVEERLAAEREKRGEVAHR